MDFHVPVSRDLRQQYREDCLSSVENREGVAETMVYPDSLDYTLESPQRGVRHHPAISSLTILATSSPEIQAICSTSMYDMAATSSSCFQEKPRDSLESSFNDQLVTLPQANRVSLSPEKVAGTVAAGPRNSDLEGVALSLHSSHLFYSPSNKENGSLRKHAPHRKPSLHRRISFDMLPTPLEIARSISPKPQRNKPTMIRTSPFHQKPRHRRNTTQLCMTTGQPIFE